MADSRLCSQRKQSRKQCGYCRLYPQDARTYMHRFKPTAVQFVDFIGDKTTLWANRKHGRLGDFNRATVLGVGVRNEGELTPGERGQLIFDKWFEQWVQLEFR